MPLCGGSGRLIPRRIGAEAASEASEINMRAQCQPSRHKQPPESIGLSWTRKSGQAIPYQKGTRRNIRAGAMHAEFVGGGQECRGVAILVIEKFADDLVAFAGLCRSACGSADRKPAGSGSHAALVPRAVQRLEFASRGRIRLKMVRHSNFSTCRP